MSYEVIPQMLFKTCEPRTAASHQDKRHSPGCHGLVQEKGLAKGPVNIAREVLKGVTLACLGPAPTAWGLAGMCHPRPAPTPKASEAWGGARSRWGKEPPG